MGRTSYDGYIRNGLITQLIRIKLGNDIEESHMRNRQLVSTWAYEKGLNDNVIEKIKKDNKTYYIINDYKKLRVLFGDLLREIQRIKSEGDYEAGKNLIENYGVKVFDCFPQIVGEVALAHDATDSIATFDVTWSYLKWNPFKMGGVGNRSRINLAIGEFRNEKDGFPFLEDLPEELSGPLSGAMNQGITTGPMSNLSNLLG